MFTRTCVFLALALCVQGLLKPKERKLQSKENLDRSGFHGKGVHDCKRPAKTVRLKSSMGPRKVTFEETKKAGYMDEPQLKQIFYLNTDQNEKGHQHMEEILASTMKNTKVNLQLKEANHSEIKYSRYKAWTVKDMYKKGTVTKEAKRLMANYSNGELNPDAKENEKVVAIWLTQVKLLEEIAQKADKVHSKPSDFSDVYFILEDDVAFVHDKRSKEEKTDWIEQAMCHISKLPADWDMYKFGYWGESIARRPGGNCGRSKAFNDYSCQQRDVSQEGQFEIMGNQAYAIRPSGAKNILRYLKTKPIMDVDGAMLPMQWSPFYQPVYYSSRVPLVWHHAPHLHNLYNFLQRRANVESEEKKIEEAYMNRAHEELNKIGEEFQKIEKLEEGTEDLLDKPKKHHKKLKDNEKEVSNVGAPPNKMPAPVSNVNLQAWYVNLPGSKERRECISRQLSELGFEPHRFQGVSWPKSCGNNHVCLKQSKVADCISGGIAWGGVTTHGTAAEDDFKTQRGVLANWCSHKRLFKKLEDNRGNSTKEEYYLVLEDDVALHKDFKNRIENFIENYKGLKWNFVQIDPFGKISNEQERWDRGPISIPKVDGEWFGMHAWLVRGSALPKLNKWMTEHKAIPIDWIPKRMKNFIAWKPHIAENPEVIHSGGGVHIPAYCNKDKVMTSDIAGEHVH